MQIYSKMFYPITWVSEDVGPQRWLVTECRSYSLHYQIASKNSGKRWIGEL